MRGVLAAGKRSVGRMFLGLLLVLLLGSTCWAQSPAVQSGLGWLAGNQASDGRWTGHDVADVPATTEALKTLTLLNPASPALAPGRAWLRTQDNAPTDSLARRIVAEAGAGGDIAASVTALLALRGPNSGWGGADGYQENVLDTCLALQALKAAASSDSALLYPSLRALILSQNPDGGWGLYAGAPSHLLITALAVETLNQWRWQYAVDLPVNRGTTYLLGQQGSQGGFGPNGGTVVETALTLIALLEQGEIDTTVRVAGLSAKQSLLTAQQANGSWNDTPFATALALRALGMVKPDLALTTADLSATPAAPLEGESLTVTARVRNRGFDHSGNAVARLYDGTTLLAEQPLAVLAPGAETVVDFPLENLAPLGAHTLAVQVDPLGTLELRDDNNRAELRLWVTGRPDLVVLPESLAFTPAAPLAGSTTTLSAWIPNHGESPATNINLTLYLGDPRSGGSAVAQGNLAAIATGAASSASLTFVPPAPGTQTVCLSVDVAAGTPELATDNNLACKSLEVRDPAAGVTTDLALVGAVQLDPARPRTGEAATLTVEAMNLGAASAVADLELFDGAVEQGGVLIKRQSLSLNPGESRSVTIPWTALSGRHTLVAYLDRGDQVIESDESNNRQDLAMMSDMVDLLLSVTDLTITPSQPLAGDAANVAVVVHNVGIEPTGAFEVTLYNGDPAAGGALLQTFTVSDLEADATTQLVYPLTAERGTYRFHAVVDSGQAVSEFDEGNNLAIRSLLVKDSSETNGPDLVPVAIEFYALTQDSQTLRISGTAGVTVQNRGDDKVMAPYRVTIFEDRDNNGAFDADRDNVLGQWDYSQTMWPNGVAPLAVPFTGTLSFRDSPLYAMVDSDDTVVEAKENNNLIRRGSDCERPLSKSIDPEVMWRWKGPYAYEGMPNQPVIANLTDDNGDGAIDDRDHPDLVCNVPHPGYAGQLWAFKGESGEVIFSLQDPDRALVFSGGSLAVGDIDRDGYPEIAALKGSSPSGMLLFAHDGTLKWNNQAEVAAWNNANPFKFAYLTPSAVPALADLDADGKTEIFVAATVISPSGQILASRHTNTGGGLGLGPFAASVAADLDLDGQQEIMAGNTAYNHDSSVKWYNKNLPDGSNAIGNFDDDPFPEIVLVSSLTNPPDYSTRLYLLEHDGTVKWGPIMLRPFDGYPGIWPGGYPIVADFDGDGEPEIGVRGSGAIFVFDRHGQLQRTIPFTQYKGAQNSAMPSVFDLDGNGVPEVLFKDADRFKIFNGKNGDLLFFDIFEHQLQINSDAVHGRQNTFVADLDKDGHAEIVVIGNDKTTGDNIRVYRSRSRAWVAARGIHNQNTYHVTNINDDGTIPRHEAPSWLLNNSYRTNVPVDPPPATNPYLSADLSSSFLRVNMAGYPGSLSVTARIGNGGARAVPAGAMVAMYDGDPAVGGTLVATTVTGHNLEPGDYEDVSLIWTAPGDGEHDLRVYADRNAAGAGTVDECNEENNLASLTVTVRQGTVVTTDLPDLALAAEDVVISGGDLAGSLLQVSVPVRNTGSIAADNVAVRLTLGDPQRGGVAIDGERIISSLAPGESHLVTFAWPTPSAGGTNYLYLRVDPDNLVSEANEGNNLALTRVDLRPAQAPDLELVASDLRITPTTPVEGETLTVTATVRNRGASVGDIKVALFDGDPAQGGLRRGETVVAPLLATGASATVTFALDTLNWSGTHTLFVLIDPDHAILEENEGNNRASHAVTVLPANVQLAVATSQSAYAARSVIPITLTILDQAPAGRALTWEVRIEEASGLPAASVGGGSVTTAGNGLATTLAVTGQTGTLASGAYQLVAWLRDGARVAARAAVPLTILADKTLRVALSSDKPAYAANDVAELTATVTSASANYYFGGLRLVIDVIDPQGGKVLSSERLPPVLMPGQTVTLKAAWNTATQPKGSYTLQLRAIDGSETLATAVTHVEILGSATTLAGVGGTLSAVPAIVEFGNDGQLTFVVCNQGNEALQGNVSVLLVHPETQQTLRTLTLAQPVLLAVDATYAGQLAYTADLGVNTYLAVLRFSGSSGTTSLAGTPLRIKDETPPQLSVLLPLAGTVFGPQLDFSVQAEDRASGIAQVEYRIDDGAWHALMAEAAPVGRYREQRPALPTENGEHTVTFRAVDGAGNGTESGAIPFTVVLDNQPPVTTLTLAGTHLRAESGELLTDATTTLTLTANDEGTGVAATFCGFDTEPADQPCPGALSLEALAPGAHRFHYHSVDQAGNVEAEQVLDLSRIDLTVTTTLLAHARVLVWTEESATNGGKQSAPTPEEVRALLAEAFADPDLYYTVVTDKEAFRQAVRSGIYTVVMILRQDVPLDANFQRELREAVGGGVGLLIAHWKNSVPPLWQDVFGVGFKGSLAMDEASRPLHFYAGALSDEQAATAVGRVLRTPLAGGTLAGILPADSICEGVRSVTLVQPLILQTGDRVAATLEAVANKRITPVDSEGATLAELSAGPMNRSPGNLSGDLALTGTAADGLTLTLSAPVGTILGDSYRVTVTVTRADGGSTTTILPITPTCAAHLRPGMTLGDARLVEVDEARITSGEDLPAVVTGQYGAGRTVFLAYDPLLSAWSTGENVHLDLLHHAAQWLAPAAGESEPAGIALLETTIALAGATLDLTAVDTLGTGLTHLPLYDLTQTPLTYRFRLTDGDVASYRYFVRLPDQAGDFQKETELFMDTEEGTIPYARYAHVFTLTTDSADLLQQTVLLVEELARQHPESGAALTGIDVALKTLALMPTTIAGDDDTVIKATLQILQSLEQLPFATEEVRSTLGRYLRIMEARLVEITE